MGEAQQHEIARMAAEVAGHVAADPEFSRVAGVFLSPAAAAKAVVDAYEAALKQLRASASSQS